MLTTVFAAETQFRLDSVRRDLELARLAAIRERREALAHPLPRALPARVVRPERRTWARPIGLGAHSGALAAPPAVACGV